MTQGLRNSIATRSAKATPAVAGRETGPGRTRPEAGRAASVCGAMSRFRAPPYRLSTSLRARGGARLPQEGAWTAKWRALHGSFLALLAVRAAPSRIVTVRFTGPLPTQRRGAGVPCLAAKCRGCRSSPLLRRRHAPLLSYQPQMRYTALAPNRFKDF